MRLSYHTGQNRPTHAMVESKSGREGLPQELPWEELSSKLPAVK